MALITVSGYPCSGKSTRVDQIRQYFQAKLADQSYTGPAFNVVVVDDEACRVGREVYDDSISEKPGRASVFALLQRSFGAENLVICDGLNYIKGYRYQMYCAAREAKVRVATVFVAAPPEKCREWHDARDETDKYKQETFDNLIMRFEEPSSMVRWDSPLFSFAWDDKELPLEELWLAATKGDVKSPNAAVAESAQLPADSTRTLTKTTSLVITDLLSFLSISPGSSLFRIPARNPFTRPLELHLPPGRSLTLSEMQRLKRQFETMQRKALSHGGAAGVQGAWTEQSVAEAFIKFLEGTWGLRD